MGEAKRRQQSLSSHQFTPAQRADIARVVRSVNYEIGSGSCVPRAMAGGMVLKELGVRFSIQAGTEGSSV
jgi:hypothetical protein